MDAFSGTGSMSLSTWSDACDRCTESEINADEKNPSAPTSSNTGSMSSSASSDACDRGHVTGSEINTDDESQVQQLPMVPSRLIMSSSSSNVETQETTRSHSHPGQPSCVPKSQHTHQTLLQYEEGANPAAEESTLPISTSTANDSHSPTNDVHCQLHDRGSPLPTERPTPEESMHVRRTEAHPSMSWRLQELRSQAQTRTTQSRDQEDSTLPISLPTANDSHSPTNDVHRQLHDRGSPLPAERLPAEESIHLRRTEAHPSMSKRLQELLNQTQTRTTQSRVQQEQKNGGDNQFLANGPQIAMAPTSGSSSKPASSPQLDPQKFLEEYGTEVFESSREERCRVALAWQRRWRKRDVLPAGVFLEPYFDPTTHDMLAVINEDLFTHFRVARRSVHTKWKQVDSFVVQQAWLVPTNTPQQTSMLREKLQETLATIKHRFKVLELRQFHEYLSLAVRAASDTDIDAMVPIECARLHRAREKFHTRYEREQALCSADKHELESLRLERQREILSRPRKIEHTMLGKPKADASASLPFPLPDLPESFFNTFQIGQVDFLRPKESAATGQAQERAMRVLGLGREYTTLGVRAHEMKNALQSEYLGVVKRLNDLQDQQIERQREKLTWKATDKAKSK